MKFPLHRGNLVCDPRGAQVALAYQGRTLLGDVVGCYYQEHGCAGPRLVVRHFNGERWPIDPGVLAVDVLARETEGEVRK